MEKLEQFTQRVTDKVRQAPSKVFFLSEDAVFI